MKFLMLILDGNAAQEWTPRGREEGFERMMRFTEELKSRGVYETSHALKLPSEGARVSVRDGERIVVDGPFAESKEVVGGFYLLDCPSKAAAIAIASECPAAEWGTVEVREIHA